MCFDNDGSPVFQVVFQYELPEIVDRARQVAAMEIWLGRFGKEDCHMELPLWYEISLTYITRKIKAVSAFIAHFLCLVVALGPVYESIWIG